MSPSTSRAPASRSQAASPPPGRPTRHERAPGRHRARFVDDQRVVLDEAHVALDAAHRERRGDHALERKAGAEVRTTIGRPAARARTALEDLGRPRRVPVPVPRNVDRKHQQAPAAGRGPRQRAASGAGFTPAKRAGGVALARSRGLQQPAASAAGFTPAKRAGGVASGSLQRPAATGGERTAGFTPAKRAGGVALAP